MTVREMLHNLIDRLPDEAVERIEPDIRGICEENNPAWKALMEDPDRQNLKQSAQLYAEIYDNDPELREWPE